MSCLAVLFALEKQDVEKLKSVPRINRSSYMHEEIEEVFFDTFPEYTLELDQAWDAIHRMMSDGKLDFENRFPPFCNMILGGEFLYGLVCKSGNVTIPEEEDDEYMILKTPEQVKEIALAFPEITKEKCRKSYYMIEEDDYGFKPDEEDFEYAWEYLEGSREFWLKAAEEERYVLFTADR